MKYNIVTSTESADKLAIRVNDWISMGWKPYGNPFAAVVASEGRAFGYTEYMQAMTKEQ